MHTARRVLDGRAFAYAVAALAVGAVVGVLWRTTLREPDPPRARPNAPASKSGSNAPPGAAAETPTQETAPPAPGDVPEGPDFVPPLDPETAPPPPGNVPEDPDFVPPLDPEPLPTTPSGRDTPDREPESLPAER